MTDSFLPLFWAKTAEISAVWLQQHLAEHEPNVSKRLVWVLRDALGGHHGRFAERTPRDIERLVDKSERGVYQQWIGWRDEAYTLLRELFAPTGKLFEVGEPRNIRAASVALTGFIIWSDWIGSNSDDFQAFPELL